MIVLHDIRHFYIENNQEKCSGVIVTALSFAFAFFRLKKPRNLNKKCQKMSLYLILLSYIFINILSPSLLFLSVLFWEHH